MKIFTANCPACGGAYDGAITSRFITCEFCGTRYALTKEVLDSLGFIDRDGDGIDDRDQDWVDDEEVDTTPIDEYALAACEDLLREVDNSSFEARRKILRGLDVEDNEVFLIHDDTMFKSGKNGFAITSEGLVCREMGDKFAHYVDWSDFAEAERPRVDGNYIRQDGVSLCYFTDDDKVFNNYLVPLYEDLYDHAQALL